MGDWGEIEIFSIFGCKSVEMATTSASILSEDQKWALLRIFNQLSKNVLKIA